MTDAFGMQVFHCEKDGLQKFGSLGLGKDAVLMDPFEHFPALTVFHDDVNKLLVHEGSMVLN